ncbi:hypothetical protein PHET_11171 [Paragonimus heterotremus]|uniref:Uncharacterized protein n=1 Tax=Paragonimus heterotremus TaxID=100268 RepID=A0A8J4SYL8_9TREM|nr:hypothetical protein PHET_11171 [Paragonimus heterotremus]
MADSRNPTGSRTLRQTSLEEGFSGCNSLFSQVIRISVYTRKRERLSPQKTPDYSDSPPEVSEVPLVDVNELSPSENREASTNSVFTACPLNQLGESLDSLKSPIHHLPRLRWSQGHKVFFDVSYYSYGMIFGFQCSVVSSIPFVPFPERYVDKWSEYFVRLPCSPESLYPVTENGKKSLIARWNLIEKCLRQRISTPSELQKLHGRYGLFANHKLSDTQTENWSHCIHLLVLPTRLSKTVFLDMKELS